MNAPISYSLKTAAAATGLSETYLKARIGDGTLKAKRSGENGDGEPAGKYVILARHLEAFIAELVDA
jgi:hypothetical protein